MRTNNDKVKNIIISIYFILIVLAIILATLMRSLRDIFNSPTITIFSILVLFALMFWLTHKNSKYFEYDSDGADVIILNRGLLLSDYLNYREHRAEFKKENLKGFKFNNLFVYKSLTVHIKDRRNRTYSETFNVTLLSRRKRRYIRQSLSKIIKQNKKRKD